MNPAFVPIAFILVLSPGPDSILILHNALTAGRGIGMATLAGVQVGVAIHTLLSVTGLSLLLYYSATLFGALSVAGALYLAYLGLMMFRSSPIQIPDGARRVRISPRKGFMQGMLCNLLNPKVLVLFLTIIPAFVDAEAGDVGLQIILMGLVLLAINIPVQLALVVLSLPIGRCFSSPRWGRLLHWFFGAVLLFFAAGLLLERIE